MAVHPIRRSALLVAVLASLLVAPPSRTAAQSPALPVSPGPGAPIGADDARIDSVFRFVAPGAPGCAVGVYRDGALAWARGYGLASVEHGVPIGPKTIFDLGSTSKQFTAALTLMLVAEGKVALDDPVRRHVPELPAWGDSVTVRQLLHHTAGVRDYLTLMSLGGIQTEDFTTQGDAVRVVARQRALDFAPGTDHSYSNSGYLLLAEIVARREGKSFAQVAQERIFGPLGMANSLVLDSHVRLIPNKAGSYVVTPRGIVLEGSDFEQVGDGAVQTSLEDLAKWVANYERPAVGGAALVRELETQGRLAGGRLIPYARGLMVDSLRGVRRVRHGGAWMGFRADLVRFPDKRLAMAALCNRGDANPSLYLDRVADALLDDLGVPRAGAVAVGAGANGGGATAPKPSRAVPDAGRYAGSYFSTTGGRALNVVARGDTLLAMIGEPRALTPAGARRFTVDGTPITLEFDAPGSAPGDSARGVAFSLGGASPDRLERTTRMTTVDPATRRSLVGRWHSPELDVTWTIAADSSGRLTVSMPRQEPVPMPPVTANALRMRGGVVRLERGADGAVTAFTVGAGRARGMRFERAR